MVAIMTPAQIKAAAETLQTYLRHQPRVGVVLGSGLGSGAEWVQSAEVIDTRAIPYWPVATVAGHSGQLVAGMIAGCPVLIQQGRAHYYEGYSPVQATLPVRVMQLLGVRYLILTSAVGALNPELRRGEVMLITDHINLMGLVGLSPLVGPNEDGWGPRFPDMSQVYDPQLAQLAETAAKELGTPLRRGVYVGVAGPAYETPAEVRCLRSLGGDVVAMSLAPEATVARHAGLQVLGLAGIVNLAGSAANAPLTHTDVLQAAAGIAPRLRAIVAGVISRLGQGEAGG